MLLRTFPWFFFLLFSTFPSLTPAFTPAYSSWTPHDPYWFGRVSRSLLCVPNVPIDNCNLRFVRPSFLPTRLPLFVAMLEACKVP